MTQITKMTVSDRTGDTWLHPYEGYPCVLVETDESAFLILDDEIYDAEGYIHLLNDGR